MNDRHKKEPCHNTLCAKFADVWENWSLKPRHFPFQCLLLNDVIHESQSTPFQQSNRPSQSINCPFIGLHSGRQCGPQSWFKFWCKSTSGSDQVDETWNRSRSSCSTGQAGVSTPWNGSKWCWILQCQCLGKRAWKGHGPKRTKFSLYKKI